MSGRADFVLFRRALLGVHSSFFVEVHRVDVESIKYSVLWVFFKGLGFGVWQ